MVRLGQTSFKSLTLPPFSDLWAARLMKQEQTERTLIQEEGRAAVADFFCLTWIAVMMKNYFLLYNNLKDQKLEIVPRRTLLSREEW